MIIWNQSISRQKYKNIFAYFWCKQKKTYLELKRTLKKIIPTGFNEEIRLLFFSAYPYTTTEVIATTEEDDTTTESGPVTTTTATTCLSPG